MRTWAAKSVIPAIALHAAFLLAAEVEKPPVPALRLDLQKPADRAVLKIESGRAVIDITSPSGIGRMEVTLHKGQWPREIVLRIGVKGMEGFNADNGKLAFHGRLGDDRAEVYRIENDGKRTPLPNDEKCRIRIRRAEQGIEVTLPPQLYEGRVKSFRVQWIDFYRS